MRKEDIEYWDEVANDRHHKYGMLDNIWKRQHIVSRLLESDLIGESILEIGVGAGVSIRAVRMTLYGVYRYIGTDISSVFCEYGRKFDLDVRHTDIHNLPTIEGGFTRIIALDTLEHVRPKDRQEGYAEINRVLSEHAKILINMPVEESNHDPEFDFEFDVRDVHQLAETCGMEISKYEPYIAKCPDRDRRYVWVELSR